MQPCVVAMTGVYAVTTALLVLLKAKRFDNRKRGAVKCVCSALFVAVAIVNFATNQQTYSLIALLGVLFAAAGDVFLVFMDKRRWFLTGVVSFAMASSSLSAYAICNYGLVWWSLLVFAVLIVGLVVGQKVGLINFGSSVVYLNVYTLCVALCGSMGLSLFVQSGIQPKQFLFGLGCFLYLASDICLGLYLYKFRNGVAMDCITSVLYFPALMLVALSL